MKITRLAYLGLISSIGITGCDVETAYQKTPDVVSQSQEGTVVCDPFSDSGSIGEQFGLRGKIFYLDNNQIQNERYSVFNSSLTYAKKGHDAGVDLFLSQLYIPTRYFSTGFPAGNGGQPLQVKMGNGVKTTLTEFFSVNVESSLILGDQDPAGLYQLAVIADDGVSVRVGHSKGVYKTVISSEGEHSSRFECASAPIYMKHGEALPIKVDYFQGPKQEIALTLLWRHVESANDVYSFCNASTDDRTGASKFWKFVDGSGNPLNPQIEKDLYRDITDPNKGRFKPIEKRNFFLLSGLNKC